MKEHTDHVLNEVEDTSEAIAPGVAAPADNSLISKAARFSGYQKAKIEHRMEPVKEELKKDGTMAKWGYRIVKFLGIQRSAKLGWKGYKAKKKIDRILTPEDTPKQSSDEAQR